MNELIESPFGASAVATQDSAGSRQNQSRELAETQTAYLMAQQFPRNEIAAMDRIINAFSRPTLAEKAQYQFARGGTDITGPSIRAAEAIAQQWGNLDTGWRELSRGVDATGVPYSEIEAFCVDLQSRMRKRLSFIVRHWRDTKSGGYKIKEERDVYELCANNAQRRLRACILASIPGDVTEAAMEQAGRTLQSKADTSPEKMAAMVATFEQFGVTKAAIEKRIQRRIEAITPAQVVTLKRIYTSLRDEMSAAADWFEVDEAESPKPSAPPPKPARGTWPAERFAKKVIEWGNGVANGASTVDQVLAFALGKFDLTPEQDAAIRAMRRAEPAPTIDADGVIDGATSAFVDDMTAAEADDERGPF